MDSNDGEQPPLAGAEFGATKSRLGTLGHVPGLTGASHVTVQKLEALEALGPAPAEAIKAAREKLAASGCPVLLPMRMDLESGGERWVAWENDSRRSAGRLVSRFERRFSLKAKNLENLKGLFDGIALALDQCREAGWDSPELDLSLDRIYLYFEKEPDSGPAEQWMQPRTEDWPFFTIRLLPVSLDYLFPVSLDASWHENPLPARFAALVYGALGGKVEKDGVPLLDEYRAGLTAMGQGANSYLRATLKAAPDQMAKLAGQPVAEWWRKLLEAEGILAQSGIFILPKPAQPESGEAALREAAQDAPPAAPGKGKNKMAARMAGIGVAAGFLVLGVLWLRGPGDPAGTFDDIISEADRLAETGDPGEAIRFLLYAADSMAEGPEQKAHALERAFAVRSVEAAEMLAEMEKATSPSSAARRYLEVAGWCRSQSQVTAGGRNYGLADALAAAAALGDGEAHWQLSQLHAAAGRTEEARTALAAAAAVFAGGSAASEPNPEKAAMAHEALFRNHQARESLAWLLAHYQETDPGKAAGLAEESGDHNLAASLHARMGQHDKAAEAAARGEDFEGAERFFLMAGLPDRAVAMWEERGDYERAGGVWLRVEPRDEKKAAAYVIGRAKASPRPQAKEILASPLLQGNVEALYLLAQMQDEPGNLEAAKRAYGRFLSAIPRDRSAWEPGWEGWRDEALAWRRTHDPAAVDEAEIQELLAAGRFRDAADLYERAGRLDDAADLLVNQAKLPEEAAALYRRANLPEKAAEIWEEQGEYEKVADLWVSAGDLPKAASYALAKGQSVAAADLPRGLGLLERAAETGATEAHFAIGQIQKHRDAYQALLHFANFAAALEALPPAQWGSSWAGHREEALQWIAAEGGKDWVVHLARRALEAGNEALEILKQDPGRRETAAAALKELGRREEAVEVYLAAGQPETAAALLVEMGRQEQAARVYLEAGRVEEGAAILVGLGRIEEAADAYAAEGRKGQGAALLLDAAPSAPLERREALYGKAVELGDPEGHYHLGRMEEEVRANPGGAAVRYKQFHDAVSSLSRTAWKPGWNALRQDAADRGYRIDPELFGDSVLLELAKSMPLDDGVADLLAKGKPRLAARLFLDAEQPDKAVALYLSHDLTEDAALLLVSLERHEEAADAWARAGNLPLARKLLTDRAMAVEDLDAARRLFEKAIELGSVDGAYWIGARIEDPAGNLPAAAARYLEFIEGLGKVPQESWEAAWPPMREEAFTRVKAIGSAEHLEGLARASGEREERQDLFWSSHLIWLSGNAATTRSEERAESARRGAAENGHPAANKALGESAAAAGDWAAAARHFSAAAFEPDSPSWPEEKHQAKLDAAEEAGSLYLQEAPGNPLPGLEKDEEKAIQHLLIAAEGGRGTASYRLGIVYGGSPRYDYGNAVKHFEAGATVGHADSAFRAGLCHANGHTGDERKDFAKAKRFLEMARDLGHNTAKDWLERGILDQLQQQRR